MCGRYALTPGFDFFDRFALDPDYTPGDLSDNYNVTPGQFMPIITKKDGQTLNHLFSMRWGLIPSWAKDEKIGYRLINSRANTVHQKPAFKDSFQRRRCLVPASGFYEWSKDKNQKNPYYFSVPNQPLISFAGLYDNWLLKDGSQLQTFTIITTNSNSLVSQIHDRMPVILSPQNEPIWLDQSCSQENLLKLLTPFQSNQMAVRQISK